MYCPYAVSTQVCPSTSFTYLIFTHQPPAASVVLPADAAGLGRKVLLHVPRCPTSETGGGTIYCTIKALTLDHWIKIFDRVRKIPGVGGDEEDEFHHGRAQRQMATMRRWKCANI